MSKLRDEYYKWNKTTLPMRDGVCTDYVSELEQDLTEERNISRSYADDVINLHLRIAKLEQENRTLKLEQGQCLNCTAKHKEELLVLEQEIEEYRKIYKVLQDDISFLKQQKMELLSYINNQADEYEDESARKFLLKHKEYQIQNEQG